MRSQKKLMAEELRPLVKEAAIAEASEKVWQHFESALETLNSESIQMLTDYFNGVTKAQLCKDKQLDENQFEALIRQAKRELIERLRRQCKVRQ